MERREVFLVASLALLFGFVGGRVGGGDRENESRSMVDGGMVLVQQPGRGAQQPGFFQQPTGEIVATQILMPDGRVVFRAQDGKPAAILGMQNGAGALWLLDSGGQPTLVLEAGGGGMVKVSSKEPGGEISLGSANAGAGMVLNGVAARPEVRLGMGANTVMSLRGGTAGGELVVNDGKGQERVKIGTDKGSGELELRTVSGKVHTMLNYSSNTGAMATLYGVDKARRVELEGNGILRMLESGEVKGEFPGRE